MELNKDRLRALMEQIANGKYREFARMLNIQVSQLHKILNKDSKAGPVFLGRLRHYCLEHNLPFDEFLM